MAEQCSSLSVCPPALNAPLELIKFDGGLLAVVWIGQSGDLYGSVHQRAARKGRACVRRRSLGALGAVQRVLQTTRKAHLQLNQAVFYWSMWRLAGPTPPCDLSKGKMKRRISVLNQVHSTWSISDYK